MNIIDHFDTCDMETCVVVTVSTSGGIVAVCGYDTNPQTGNSMLLEDPREMLLDADEADRLGRSLILAAERARQEMDARVREEMDAWDGAE